MKKVYVAIPAKDGNMSIETGNAVLAGMRDAMFLGWDVLMETNAQTPIESARNSEVVKFLATDATDLFFIDNDLGWGGDAFIRTLEAPVDVVGAAYPLKADAAGFAVQWKEMAKIFRVDPKTGLGEVNGVPAGFVRIKRHVLERMVELLKDHWYHEPSLPGVCGLPAGRGYEIFKHEMIDHFKHSEDFVFCRRWREMGGQIWLDPTINFTHVGKKGWIGNLGDWMKSREVQSKYAPALIDREGQMQHIYKTVPGWFEADALYRGVVAWAKEGSYLVEVGAWKGRSASFMAVEIANSKKVIAFDVIDNFKGTAAEGEHMADPDVKAGRLREAFEWHVRPVRDYISGVIVDDSVPAAGRYRDGSLDFVFIDAAHDTKSVMDDIAAWRPKIKPTGILAGDDVDYPPVREAVDRTFGRAWAQYNTRCWLVLPKDKDEAARFLATMRETSGAVTRDVPA